MNEENYTTIVLVGRAKLWSEDYDWPSSISKYSCRPEKGWGVPSKDQS